MSRKKIIAVLMKVASWILLASAAVVAFCFAMGMSEGTGAPVALVLMLEFIGLVCWWVSAGDGKKKSR